MRNWLLLPFLLLAIATKAQVRVHAHNDYLNKQPFVAAFNAGAWSIEADVFLENGEIMVAHARKEIVQGVTLKKMYLDAAAERLKGYRNQEIQLMVDIKDRFTTTYPVLLELLKPYFTTFKGKLQVTISGTRPATDTFHKYPKEILFDGLPDVVYSKRDLRKVPMISADFKKYSSWKGVGEIANEDKLRLSSVISDAGKQGKPMRFWGGPDNEATWMLLVQLGARIINTDKVNACVVFLNNSKHEFKK